MNRTIAWCVCALSLGVGCGKAGVEVDPPVDAGRAAVGPGERTSSAPGFDAGASSGGGDAGPLSLSAGDAAAEGGIVDAGSPDTGRPDAGTVVSPPRPCTGKAARTSGDSTWTVMTDSGARTALVHIPTGYDPTNPTPVVLNFHGYSGSPTQEEGLTLMDAESDSAGFVVVYPQGTGLLPSWNAGACCGTAVSDNVDDVGFTSTLLDTLEDKLCVDQTRVFVTGMSNGGFFSHRLGCEMADRIAAIAPVAGVMGIPTCTPSRPMPIMEFHGTSDPIVPYDGNAAIDYTSVADTIAGWVQRDGCQGMPATSYSNGDASCITYSQCSQGAEVTLCTISGGGHTWPGGTPFPLLGATSMDISATDAMWAFFQKHPLVL